MLVVFPYIGDLRVSKIKNKNELKFSFNQMFKSSRNIT